jgi:predicted MFS family arabinose efflux permease
MNPRTLGLILTTAICFLTFWFIEKKRANPLIRTDHLKSRQVWPIIAATLAALTGIFAAINFTVVLLSQDKHVGYGMSATASALMFLSPAAFIGLASAPFSGWLAPRIGWRTLLWTGLSMCTATLLVTTLFLDRRWIVFATFCLLGVFYNGMALTAMNGLGVILSPKDAPGSLPGLSGACFGIGAGLGIAIVAPIAAAGTLHGYREAMFLSTGITALALIASLWVKATVDQAGARTDKL